MWQNWRMAAPVIYTRPLEDEKMRTLLEKRETIVFKGLGREWQRIERQVERLGFGELYIVSQRGSRDGDTRVSLLKA